MFYLKLLFRSKYGLDIIYVCIAALITAYLGKTVPFMDLDHFSFFPMQIIVFAFLTTAFFYTIRAVSDRITAWVNLINKVADDLKETSADIKNEEEYRNKK